MAVSQFRLRLKIEGIHPAEDAFAEVGERAHDARPVLRVIQRLMERSAEEQFMTEGEASGNPWKQDKPDTVDRKMREGLDKRTEWRTGALAESLLGGTSKDTVKRLTRMSTTYGTRNFAARYQGKHRVLLQLITRDAERWSEMMANYLTTGYTGA